MGCIVWALIAIGSKQWQYLPAAIITYAVHFWRAGDDDPAKAPAENVTLTAEPDPVAVAVDEVETSLALSPPPLEKQPFRVESVETKPRCTCHRPAVDPRCPVHGTQEVRA